MPVEKEKRIAFIVPEFPAVSLTFIINQVADLLDRGVDVQVFALRRGSEKHVSERYMRYRMDKRVTYLEAPKNKMVRFATAIPRVLAMMVRAPRTLMRALNVLRYGDEAYSLVTLFWVYPFLDKRFDVVHCHFGTVATKYLLIREMLKDTTPFITTFYGYDVSHTPRMKGKDCYATLAQACKLFLVMSENMKTRILPLGIPEEKIRVLPVSIDVESYPFRAREYHEGERIEVISVGRFVEKKGLDDLLRATARVKEKSTKPFRVTIVGDGELHDQIHALARELGVTDVVDFRGFMRLEDVLKLYEASHLYVQPSKTASDGDME